MQKLVHIRPTAEIRCRDVQNRERASGLERVGLKTRSRGAKSRTSCVVMCVHTCCKNINPPTVACSCHTDVRSLTYSNRLFRQRVDGCAPQSGLTSRVEAVTNTSKPKQSVCKGSQNEIDSEQAQTIFSGRVCLFNFAPRVLAFLESMSCVLAVRATTLAFGYRSMD